MYVKDWASFVQQAEALFRSAPLRTRYVLKYRHCDGKLILKVTDDVACIKFYTDQQSDLKRVEQLNNMFFRLTAIGPDAPADDVAMEQVDLQPHQQIKQPPQRQRSQQQHGQGGRTAKVAKRRG